MVQKNQSAEPKRRGRPRAYDPESALNRATEAFWKTGYSGTSLDDLAAATGMNRPSLYAAFGDKHALYVTALARYWELGLAAMEDALPDDVPLPDGLMRVYDKALGMYFPAKGRPRGCFGIGTAATEAVEDGAIRAVFADGLRRIQARFEARLRLAQQNGELRADADPAALAMLAAAVLHSLALRARAGTPRRELEDMARKMVSAICA
jgi:TetR/AcrR family transcriptional regulator, copper-responsive repressor